MYNEKISVCMATYNGAKYITEQINSILAQLQDADELIIVDDASSDATVEIINKIQDPRIIVTVNETNVGVNKSFEKAISLSKNDYVFLSDQDDIWMELRVEKMLDALKQNNSNLVSGNSLYIDSEGNEINFDCEPLKEKESHKKYLNIAKIFKGTGAYFGCTMAFQKELKSIILPFPSYVESHDLWIVLVSILQGKSYHLEDTVLYRRIHGNNASIIRRSLSKKLYSRIIFLVSIINIIYRLLKNKHFFKRG